MPPTADIATLTIRPMRDADRDTVIDLIWQSNRHEAGLDPAGQPFAQDRDTEREAATATLESERGEVAEHGGALVVAEEAGAVVGYLCWLVQDADPFVRAEVRGYGYVADLVVTEEQRGRGIGRRLLAEAEALTRRQGLKRLAIGVLCGNDGAIRTYRRFGFKDFALEMLKALD